MLLSHQNWTLRDHQSKVRNDYGDVTRQKKPGDSTQNKWVSFFLLKLIDCCCEPEASHIWRSVS